MTRRLTNEQIANAMANAAARSCKQYFSLDRQRHPSGYYVEFDREEFERYAIQWLDAYRDHVYDDAPAEGGTERLIDV